MPTDRPPSIHAIDISSFTPNNDISIQADIPSPSVNSTNKPSSSHNIYVALQNPAAPTLRNGTVKFEEKDRIDYAAVTVQLLGCERVLFLFTIKQLVASGKPDSFSGEFIVPSYQGSSSLDLKGCGGSTGYDNAVALPADCIAINKGDKEELEKENIMNVSSSIEKITLNVSKSKPETGEVIGVFESIQPSDTNLGSKAPKDVKIQGVWYTQLDS
ncbi:unnamed protein product [Fraxinus pennsylvanica]|uniref:Uncharacterized protein n=1 Tax=Fraxinus pennsylvanica TaxID=56036 RepID=A0AAD2A8M7_9LAMI|nr:unnamed protein product [Fraxinus pennsylvanica]